MSSSSKEDEGFGLYPNEIVAILYRRRYWLIAPIAAALLIVGLMIAMQRPMYRSSATLLIDTQAIPTSVVASPLTTIANDRIAKIRQQITTRDSLMGLIQRHNLYREERDSLSLPDVLERLRSAIEVQLLGAEEGSDRGNTIAFTLSFTYEDAAVAKAVAADLTRLFLVEDKRFRTAQATGTAIFLGRSAEELRRELAALEDKRRGVENRYAGAMPDQVSLNAQSAATLRAELSRIDAETQGLVQQNSLLAGRANEAALAPTPEQISLDRAEERLTQLTATYADDFPEVVAMRTAVEHQRAALQRHRAAPRSSVIESEIAAGRDRIQMLSSRRTQLAANISDLEHRATEAPQASYELNAIQRDYDNIKRQYESLRQKQIDAQVAANLQSEDKGERFSVIDEPDMPHESLGKKPKTIILTGLVIGLGFGVFGIIAFEIARGIIHGEGTLTRVMGAAPMGIIPMAQPHSLPPKLHERLIKWLTSPKIARA